MNKREIIECLGKRVADLEKRVVELKCETTIYIKNEGYGLDGKMWISKSTKELLVMLLKHLGLEYKEAETKEMLVKKNFWGERG